MALDRRQFLAISVLAPAAAIAGTAARVRGAAAHTFALGPDGSAFLLDGRPFQIRSGEMHPARIPVEYWRHRIRMAKAMGMNTIAVYVFWNYSEERPGVFDFQTDRRDIAAFVRLCQAEGMWVLLRPGPYCCGEWDLGGIPPYLLAHPDIKLRVSSAEDPRYMAAVRRYIQRLTTIVKPLLVSRGGPILLIQIENEYGSYAGDVAYLEEIRQIWRDGGIDGPFYTEDGLSQLKKRRTIVSGGAIALSDGDAASIAETRALFPAVPAFAGEVYPGWLTHWGDRTFAGQEADISAQLRAFMTAGLSFNLYVIHGGTTFGFFAGANEQSGQYQPDITSYDYSAPITEQGVPTGRYADYRHVIAPTLTDPLPDVPPPIPTIARTGVDALTAEPFASIWDNLPASIGRSEHPAPMEMHGQNSGCVLYRARLNGYAGGALDLSSAHDYATVFLDGRYQGGVSRAAFGDGASPAARVVSSRIPLALQSSSSSPTLDVLVEGMGRINYGQGIVDRKGLVGAVALRDAGTLTGDVTDWQTFSLPMDERFIAALKPRITDAGRPGIFFRCRVDLETVGDTYIDMSGWTKGIVWVNGHNLGRYWYIGPQRRLYCPASWLRPAGNAIVIFDLHRVESAEITFERTLA